MSMIISVAITSKDKIIRRKMEELIISGKSMKIFRGKVNVVCEEGELEEESVCSILEHTAFDGKKLSQDSLEDLMKLLI